MKRALQGGAIISGVQVTRVNEGTKFTRTVIANDAGQYVAEADQVEYTNCKNASSIPRAHPELIFKKIRIPANNAQRLDRSR